MTNRREFPQIAATTTAWPLVARTAQAVDRDLLALAVALAPKPR
jgi:hypothetical protein